MRCVFLMGMLLTSSVCVRAQGLSVSDSVEVQQKALRHVRQFEGLLNLVAQPDEYFRKYSFTKLIQSFYDQQSDYQIFRDSLVAVEDDLNPKARPDDDNFLNVKDYLEAFFSFYEKSPVASVFFSDYKVSPIKQGEFTYVEVFYSSEFTNKHRAYPDNPYPTRHNKATLRAQLEQGEWQVVIANINYYDPGQGAIASVAEDLSLLTNQLSPSDNSSSGSGTVEDSLTTVLQNDKPIENISEALADSSGAWQVLNRIDRSSDYQLRLYDAVSVFKPAEQLPFVSNPITTRVDSTAEQKNNTQIFNRFLPLIRRVGPSSVQIAFNNPADDSLSVELINPNQQVLYLEKVGGKQNYARAINLENLEEGAYQVRLSNADYDHAVRIYYYQSERPNSANQRSSRVFRDFNPFIVKQNEDESVKVIFRNPSDDPVKVELIDMEGLVLYSEEVGSNEMYGKSISLINLYRGSYQVKISHDDYEHTVRITY